MSMRNPALRDALRLAFSAPILAAAVFALAAPGAAQAQPRPGQGSGWAMAPGAGVPVGGHWGPVSAVLDRGSHIVSAGEDGFLEVWSGEPGAEAATRFQATGHRIVAMAGRPGRSEVSIVESDGRGLYRVSAWNYRERRSLFRQDFRSPIAHISYSMGGSFVIAGAAGAPGLVFMSAASGAILPSPSALGGTVALAATGRAERNIMVYLSSGFISYRDLGTGAETNRFSAPPNLSSPALFGSSRFIAGIGAQGGLSVVDAVSGSVVALDASVPAGALLASTDEALYELVNMAGRARLRRLAMDHETGSLAALAVFDVPFPDGQRFTAMHAAGGRVALGTAGGAVAVAGQEPGPRRLADGGRRRILDAAVSGGSIAFLAEGGVWGFLPLSHSDLADGASLGAGFGAEGYGRVSPFDCGSGGGEGEGRFIFWQSRGSGYPAPSIGAPGAGGLEGLDLRFPLRSVSSFGGRAMFMDSGGNLAVLSPLEEGGSPFSFSSVGLLDGAFIDGDRLILGRSALSGGTPFLSLNVVTGETVPIAHPAQAGIMMQRGASGSVYAVTVSAQASGAVTSILRMDPASAADSALIAEFPGERPGLSFAEAPAGIASALGGEAGAIHPVAAPGRPGRRPPAAQRLERTGGFPRSLLSGGRSVVSLDSDGNLAWHDGQSGRLQAVFRLESEGWTLQTQRRIIRGAL